MKQKTVLRGIRFALLAGVALLLGLVLRNLSRFTIPERDQSLSPDFTGGRAQRRIEIDELDRFAVLTGCETPVRRRLDDEGHAQDGCETVAVPDGLILRVGNPVIDMAGHR